VYGYKNHLTYEDSDRWTGYRNGETFLEDLKASKVKSTLVREVEGNLAKVKTAESKRIQFYNSVEGFTPIVPLALMGVPESMVNQRMVKQKSKIVNVVIDCTAPACVEPNELAKASTELVGAVASLEKQGYRVNLLAGFVSCNHYKNKDCNFVLVKIKDAGQPLNLSRMLFPFTTAAFTRRLCFAWYERKEGIVHEDGYGTSLFACKERKEGLAKSLGNQTVVLATSEIVVDGLDVSNALKEAVA